MFRRITSVDFWTGTKARYRNLMYEYKLKRSVRKTLSLEITKELEILVRAPKHVPAYELYRFVGKHGEWIAANLERRRSLLEMRPEPSAEEAKELKLRAKAYLPSRVAFYADVMGLSPASVKITSAEKRYGSCSHKNGLCFSYRLMLCPNEAIDYVVVHELAHILHKNHGKGFYALIASVLPDYKERIVLLKGK